MRITTDYNTERYKAPWRLSVPRTAALMALAGSNGVVPVQRHTHEGDLIGPPPQVDILPPTNGGFPPMRPSAQSC